MFPFFPFVPTQVANAAKMNASAVLIYPDPADYLFESNAQLFGHVSVDRLAAWHLKMG